MEENSINQININMGKNEFTKLFTFLEKYGINFNEYMLAKMLAWAQTKQNAEV